LIDKLRPWAIDTAEKDRYLVWGSHRRTAFDKAPKIVDVNINSSASPPAPAPAPDTRLKNIFIVVFFGLQLYLALPGLLHNQYEDDGRFSWNMYSSLYRCDVRYDLIRTDGVRLPIDYRKLLNNPTRSYEFMNRSDLPKFNQFVCTVARPLKGMKEVRASAVCRLNDRPPVQFIKPDIDICTTENYGVVPP
jgi:hypothetical protein